MKSFQALICLAVATALVVAVPDLSQSQTLSTGVLTANAPVFLLPDATRVPLETLTKGTTVRILQRQGDWYRIEFRDPRFGDRTGYVRAENITVQPSAKPPAPSQSKVPPSGAPRAPARRTVARTPRLPVTVSFNAGVQATSRNFEATSTFQRNVETGRLTSKHVSDSPYMFDGGVHAGVWRALSVGIAATWTSKPQDGEVTAEVPHPFFFNRPRSVSGVSEGLRREEVSVHLNAAWTVPVTSSTRVAFFAGPSYFQVTQGLVTDVAVSEDYPYDTASFLSATTTEATQKEWGYNVGIDVSHGVWKYVGVGFMARYSRASFTFPIVSGHEVDVDAGGLQAGGGLRLRW